MKNENERVRVRGEFRFTRDTGDCRLTFTPPEVRALAIEVYGTVGAECKAAMDSTALLTAPPIAHYETRTRHSRFH